MGLYEFGFNNVNHFIRSFKKIENITPLQYRKNTGSTRSMGMVSRLPPVLPKGS